MLPNRIRVGTDCVGRRSFLCLLPSLALRCPGRQQALTFATASDTGVSAALVMAAPEDRLIEAQAAQRMRVQAVHATRDRDETANTYMIEIAMQSPAPSGAILQRRSKWGPRFDRDFEVQMLSRLAEARKRTSSGALVAMAPLALNKSALPPKPLESVLAPRCAIFKLFKCCNAVCLFQQATSHLVSSAPGSSSTCRDHRWRRRTIGVRIPRSRKVRLPSYECGDACIRQSIESTLD